MSHMRLCSGYKCTHRRKRKLHVWTEIAIDEDKGASSDGDGRHARGSQVTLERCNGDWHIEEGVHGPHTRPLVDLHFPVLICNDEAVVAIRRDVCEPEAL